MSKIKSFGRKLKAFCKRNAYALVVSFCVLAVFSVITAVSVADLYKVDSNIEQNGGGNNNDDAQQTGTETVIVFDSPVKDGQVSKEYIDDGIVEDKTSGAWMAHQGIDYAGPAGTKVYAVYDGTVEKIDNTVMDGTVIVIAHNDNLKSIYKCLASDVCVSVGDRVEKGAEIGTMGTSTNEKAEGTHLHFEVMLKDKLVDPNDYLSDKK